jgi:pre-mRNA-splicing factor 38A
MANLTDPLANAVHGTDPQSLMEYITRQKIYDSRYWKEECFGLSAVNVLEKATKLQCVGASFGGNSQPTKFLSLLLKLLQIQPDPAIVDEFLHNEDFKYVRVLGAFYKRLSGRPANIYESLEPLLTDYRKLRYRDTYEWRLQHVDEFIHALLTESRVCGISLPRLPARQVLQDEGYLDEYKSPIVLEPGQTLNDYLKFKVNCGSIAAQVVWKERKARRLVQDGGERHGRPMDVHGTNGVEEDDDRDRQQRHVESIPNKRTRDDDQLDRVKPKKRQHKGGNQNYGMLFKASSQTRKDVIESGVSSSKVEEHSDEYWNEQRAKLGLAPLKRAK